MPDFETGYDAIKSEMAKLDTQSLTLWDKACAAALGWPYWAPVVVVAAIAGHYV